MRLGTNVVVGPQLLPQLYPPLMSAQTGRFVKSADGTSIWADDAGNKNGVPVVFIHGLACTSIVFDLQFSDPKLLENLYMVKYELRGHGRSGKPIEADAYGGRRYAEDFIAVCKAFGLVKPFVCGWFVLLTCAEGEVVIALSHVARAQAMI